MSVKKSTAQAEEGEVDFCIPEANARSY